MTLIVGRYDSQECEIELENISMDDNGNWTCLILESLSTNRTDQDTVTVKVIDFPTAYVQKPNENSTIESVNISNSQTSSMEAQSDKG